VSRQRGFPKERFATHLTCLRSAPHTVLHLSSSAQTVRYLHASVKLLNMLTESSIAGEILLTIFTLKTINRCHDWSVDKMVQLKMITYTVNIHLYIDVHTHTCTHKHNTVITHGDTGSSLTNLKPWTSFFIGCSTSMGTLYVVLFNKWYWFKKTLKHFKDVFAQWLATPCDNSKERIKTGNYRKCKI